ncbi:MAG: GNAT family protein [Alphaproteobacteria bacterium]|nr:GNAT family protein [Alphaproteobacteria bacterium]
MLIEDNKGLIARFVSEGLKEPSCDWIGSNYTVGIVRGRKLLGGVIFNDYRPKKEVWLTLYTTSPLWATKKDLRDIFKIAFEGLKVKRLSLLISAENPKSLSLAKRLGFKKEGVLRQFLEDGQDALVFSMLEEEFTSSFLNKGEKEK